MAITIQNGAASIIFTGATDADRRTLLTLDIEGQRIHIPVSNIDMARERAADLIRLLTAFRGVTE